MSDDEHETLSSLIKLTKGRQSYEDLATESARVGGKLTSSRWAQLGAGSPPLSVSPGKDALRTIASVLQVSDTRLWAAVGRSLELDLRGDEEPLIVRRLPRRADILTPAQVDAVIGVVEELVTTQGALEATEGANASNVRRLRAARKTTGTESRGPRGGAKTR